MSDVHVDKHERKAADFFLGNDCQLPNGCFHLAFARDLSLLSR